MYVFGLGQGCVGARIGLGLYQSCRNRGSVSVLLWCSVEWVGGLVQGGWGAVMSVLSLDFLCRWQDQVNLY